MVMLSGCDITVIPKFGTNLDTKREDAMRSEKEFNIRDYSYYSYGVGIVKLAFIVGVILGLVVVFTGVAEAEDNKTSGMDFDKIGWPTQILYDSVNGCQQGTIRWIITVNPALAGLTPPPHVQRFIAEHCFCVLDRFRDEYNYTEYINLLINSRKKPGVIGELYMQTALTCVKDNGTLPGIMVIEASTTDNQTKTDNSTTIPEKSEAPAESLPDQPEEPSSEPETILQG